MWPSQAGCLPQSRAGGAPTGGPGSRPLLIRAEAGEETPTLQLRTPPALSASSEQRGSRAAPRLKVHPLQRQERTPGERPGAPRGRTSLPGKGMSGADGTCVCPLCPGVSGFHPEAPTSASRGNLTKRPSGDTEMHLEPPGCVIGPGGGWAGEAGHSAEPSPPRGQPGPAKSTWRRPVQV